jgi:uncharacterized repeat protein (TIGR03803 family)
MRPLNSFPSAFGLLLIATILAAGSYADARDDYKVLHSFGKGQDGAGVFAGVVLDDQGRLYGATTGGGAYGHGTVFRLAPGLRGKWTESILHSFCSVTDCKDGASPSGVLVFDSEGNLYGGSNIATFEMIRKADGWAFHVLCDCITPSVFDAAGNLYGIGGPGTYNAGAVAELSPLADGWKENLLYSFCSQRPGCRDGEPPEWNVTFDSAGNLYGTTELGGNAAPFCSGSGGCGVAYQLQSLGGGKWQYHVLHRFAAFPLDGQLPYSGVVVDGSGNVYGTTIEGGSTRNNTVCLEGCGTVFKLTKQADGQWKETILYNFPNYVSNGDGPIGGLVLDPAGNLYGTTSAGGDPVCQCGVVFKMSPGAGGKWTYSVLHRFTGKDGWSPQASLIFDKGYKHLYGTTIEGGPGGYGVVFEITP